MPTSTIRWKRLFVIVETFVVLACFYGLTLKFSWHYSPAAYRILPSSPAKMIWWISIAGAMFLLLASPFFLRPLRFVAIGAWVIGAMAFVCALWLAVP